MAKPFNVVTGAFGYSGRYIAQRFLDKGISVRTLTNSGSRQNQFGGRVTAFPLRFDDVNRLAESLEGCDVLCNTYWVRFNHTTFNHAAAVRNSETLFAAARKAGVRRVVHVSITNPSEDSPYEYFRGKAQIERFLVASGLSYAILRPAVFFGGDDVLINNIAWMLRRFPLFGVFGDGLYRLQPIHVEDFAGLVVEQSAATDNCVLNAIGPETFTFRGLVNEIARILGKRRPLVSLPASAGYLVGRLMGRWLGDVVITREEIDALMAGLLAVDARPLGTTRLSTWATEHADELGVRYASELGRRKDRQKSYASLR